MRRTGAVACLRGPRRPSVTVPKGVQRMARVAGHDDVDDVSVALPEARPSSADLIALDDRYSAHNYHPLPVVVADAEGAWVTDV